MNRTVLALIFLVVLLLAFALAQPGGVLDSVEGDAVDVAAPDDDTAPQAPPSRAAALESDTGSFSDDDLIDDAAGIEPVPDVVFDGGSDVGSPTETPAERTVAPDIVPEGSEGSTVVGFIPPDE